MSKTNPALAIFMGKNVLDQTDKQEIRQTGSNVPQLTDAERKALAEPARIYKINKARA